ncbi:MULTISPECIES: phage holin family protein [Saccharopolyspora]|uniref:Phage holin family protein n=1 Tax=Saccharopolyspora cebuensis TaxID=418759 RepID=A0ABV4CHM5_9PSEU
MTDLSDQLTRLVRSEMRLAQRELQTKGKQAGIGAAMFGAAGILAMFGGATLVAVAVLALALVLPAWLSALIVAAVLLAAAGIAALVGRTRLRRTVPGQRGGLVESVNDDYHELSEAVRK